MNICQSESFIQSGCYIFLDVQGILFINYLEKGRTINSKYYITLLVHLKEEIAKKKQPQMKKKKVLFHQDNATCHQSVAMMAKLPDLHFHLLPYPPYSPDLAPQQLLAFCKLQKNGKRFGSNEEVILETVAYFEAKDKSFYKNGIELLEEHWNQYITLEGD